MMFGLSPTNIQVNALPRSLNEFQARGKAARNENGSEDVRKIERSIAYMTQHLNQPVRVAELAAQANISPAMQEQHRLHVA
jgi:transcriptional regulator GlxA family with amidase domain